MAESERAVAGRLRLIGVCSLLMMTACAVPQSAGSAESSDSGPSGATIASASVSAGALETATAAALPDCDLSALSTRTHGVLTVATGEHSDPPWFTGDDLTSSDGYEASVARAVAATLGFEPDRIAWLRVDTDQAIVGSTTEFDMLIDRVAEPQVVTDNVDLSTGYYAITDAVLVPRSEVDRLGGSSADLRTMRLGVIAGSSGEATTRGSGLSPSTLPTIAAGVHALEIGAIDGFVMSTPDALDLESTAASLSVLGQLPPGKWQPEQFHLVLAKDSPLTPCVSAAVDRLRVEGTLDQLTQRWVVPLAPPLG